jgi:hypothetical protein
MSEVEPPGGDGRFDLHRVNPAPSSEAIIFARNRSPWV